MFPGEDQSILGPGWRGWKVEKGRDSDPSGLQTLQVLLLVHSCGAGRAKLAMVGRARIWKQSSLMTTSKAGD